MILLAWTVFMFFISAGLMAVYSDEPTDPGVFAFGGICCPIALYCLIAIPLAIAAIATLEIE
ncbi:hypothetical protein D6833_11780 [Candidatus Parcubacteria bacterium]|nr:MAG: hypothetical protein D6833_11780 [Candidatus Parcubacteria bacterium]